MNIGEAATRSGVTAKTIRYYESIGLIGQADRRGNNYRTYSESDVATLGFIARSRSLGFSVKEVGQLLALWRDRKRTSRAVKSLALGQMAEIDRKIAELKSVRRAIEKLTDCCHGDDRPDCPILEDLARPPTHADHIAR
jgi:MerR family copper efflux transcriptional regulator